MQVNKQHFPNYRAARASISGYQMVDFDDYSALSPEEALASYIQGSLSIPTCFAIPWAWEQVARMALFNAPLTSAVSVFLLEPAPHSKVAAVMSREPS